MSSFEYAPTAENVMAWLHEGGYSSVLYVGKHRAYTCDEDLDRDEGGGWFPLPVAIARKLLTDGKIAVWDDGADELTHKYIRYRPANWVAAWNMGQRPWFSTAQNRLILNAHEVDEALKAEAMP